MTDTISRDEYNSKRRHDYAGTAAGFLEPATVAAWRLAAPDWDGKYWHMGAGARGTFLGPVNVIEGNELDEYKIGDRVRFTRDALRRGVTGLGGPSDVGTVTRICGSSVTVKFPHFVACTSTGLVEPANQR